MLGIALIRNARQCPVSYVCGHSWWRSWDPCGVGIPQAVRRPALLFKAAALPLITTFEMTSAPTSARPSVSTSTTPSVTRW